MKKIFFLLLFFALVLSACAKDSETAKKMSVEEAKTFVADFINKNLMPAGQEVSIKEVIDENGLYKVTVNMTNGQEIICYLTKDGAKFFPQVMDVKEIVSQKDEQPTAQNNETPAPADVPKAEKASVELFVMSHCPYGTQIEKGILPVLEKLGDKIDFELKFCDYAMHGEKEVDEQLNQVCIQKNEPNKLLAYLNCFLEADDGPGCLAKTGINKSKLASCVTSTDKEYKVKELFQDKSSWKSGRFPQFNVFQADNQKYGVGGSPTLVINGSKISAQRDSASLLKTICAWFENPPAECQVQLSSTPPSPGFGFSGTGSGAAAECGS